MINLIDAHYKEISKEFGDRFFALRFPKFGQRFLKTMRLRYNRYKFDN